MKKIILLMLTLVSLSFGNIIMIDNGGVAFYENKVELRNDVEISYESFISKKCANNGYSMNGWKVLGLAKSSAFLKIMVQCKNLDNK